MLCWSRADACAAASTYTMATACAAAAGCAINHCSASGTLERLLSPMLYIFLQSRRLRQLGKFLGVGPPGRCRRRGPPPSRSFWPRKRLHNHTCAIFWGRRKKRGKKRNTCPTCSSPPSTYLLFKGKQYLCASTFSGLTTQAEALRVARSWRDSHERNMYWLLLVEKLESNSCQDTIFPWQCNLYFEKNSSNQSGRFFKCKLLMDQSSHERNVYWLLLVEKLESNSCQDTIFPWQCNLYFEKISSNQSVRLLLCFFKSKLLMMTQYQSSHEKNMY